MLLKPITEGLPSELQIQLNPNENVYYFSYISTVSGGCLSSKPRDEYWIALTDRRVIYKVKVMENNNFLERSGILPFEKISFIQTEASQQTSGCSSTKMNNVRISTSGGTIAIPVPTQEKGNEITSAYNEINEEFFKKPDQNK